MKGCVSASAVGAYSSVGNRAKSEAKFSASASVTGASLDAFNRVEVEAEMTAELRAHGPQLNAGNMSNVQGSGSVTADVGPSFNAFNIQGSSGFNVSASVGSAAFGNVVLGAGIGIGLNPLDMFNIGFGGDGGGGGKGGGELMVERKVEVIGAQLMVKAEVEEEMAVETERKVAEGAPCMRLLNGDGSGGKSGRSGRGCHRGDNIGNFGRGVENGSGIKRDVDNSDDDDVVSGECAGEGGGRDGGVGGRVLWGNGGDGVGRCGNGGDDFGCFGIGCGGKGLGGIDDGGSSGGNFLSDFDRKVYRLVGQMLEEAGYKQYLPKLRLLETRGISLQAEDFTEVESSEDDELCSFCNAHGHPCCLSCLLKQTSCSSRKTERHFGNVYGFKP